MERFEFKVKFGSDEFDSNGRLKADRIFYYFQEVSEGDVNARGVGPKDLMRQNQIWVLTKMRIMIQGDVKPGEEYVCGTFPVRKKSVTYKRDYYIKKGDEILIRGAAQWCILDFDTRKPLRTDIEFEEALPEEEMITGIFPKIRCEDPDLLGEHTVTEEDIDFNDHTNNSRYIAIAEQVTGENVTEELFVNFASETRLGDVIVLYGEKQESQTGPDAKATYVEGRNRSGERIYQMLFR
ncbi:MAG: thioesterase [Bacillota bacterium]|nr:thioesterase [Bacillota bacterium]